MADTKTGPVDAAAPVDSGEGKDVEQAVKVGAVESVTPPQGIPELTGGYHKATYLDIFKQFVLLGWVAFGGPQAHIGLFEKVFVEKHRWMSHDVFMELFALGQCMPGPTSTQVSFAIGTMKKGISGGLLSGALFQYPGAVIMTLVGWLAAEYFQSPKGWLAGFTGGVSAAGVALVASAAKGLCFKICNSRLLAVICTGAAVATYYHPTAYMFPTVIALGGLITVVVNRKMTFNSTQMDDSVQSHGLGYFAGALLLVIWLATLVITIVLVRVLDSPPSPLKWFEGFFRTGSIIFGGGQVVLPMLFEVVTQQSCDAQNVCKDLPSSWVSSEQFYAGLGLVQALPGPLFNFAAYLGAIIAMNAGYVFIVGAILCWVGLFAPGILIIFGIFPFWGKFRNWVWYKRGLPGLNAAGVGLVVSAVFSLTMNLVDASPFPKTTIGIGVIAFSAVDQLKLFEPGVVIGGGVIGIIAWALDMM